MRRSQVGLIFAMSVCAGAAVAQPPNAWEGEPDQVFAAYYATLNRAQVSGTCGSLEWMILKSGDGTSQVRLRMEVDLFTSGHPDVDAALRAAMESHRFPFVEIEGTAREVDSTLRGTITMHGVQKPLTATLTQTGVRDQLLLRAAFTVSLHAFRVVTPVLGGERIGDVVEVSIVGLLRVHPDSVLSMGVIRTN